MILFKEVTEKAWSKLVKFWQVCNTLNFLKNSKQILWRLKNSKTLDRTRIDIQPLQIFSTFFYDCLELRAGTISMLYKNGDT